MTSRAFLFPLAVALLIGCPAAMAQTPATPTPKKAPLRPTLADVPYGPHEHQKLDFYRAKAADEKPTPVVFFIHGGGWIMGDKAGFNGEAPYLAAGISVVSINYRLIADAEAQGVKPPVDAPLHDAARALQFVRSKAAEWHLDKARIGASGSSAGACSSLWLAFHPDMAEPQSADPVARESTRLWCAAVWRAQTSLDPEQMTAWIPNNNYGAHAFGFKGDPARGLNPYQQFAAERSQILPWIAEYSPYALLTPDDPPIYLIYNTPPAMGEPQQSTAHSANFGVKLQERCRELGVECELVYPGAPEVKHVVPEAYLIEKLRAGRGSK
jgi:acetyl esterase/lipase